MSDKLAEPLLEESATVSGGLEGGGLSDNSSSGPTINSNNNNMTRATITCPLVSAVSISIMPTFLFGFNTGCLNALQNVVFPGHSTAQWAAAVSSFCLGGIMGARYAGPIADRRGRRWALLCVGWVYITAGILHIVAPNMAVLIVGRSIVGIAGGASTVLTPIYLGEISPTAIRGSIGTMTQVSVVLGILASVLLALPYATETEWRYIFLPIPAIGLIQIIAGALLLPESPRWLRLKGREQAARDTLNLFSGGADRPEASNDDGSEVEMIQGGTLDNANDREDRFGDDENDTEVSDSDTHLNRPAEDAKPFCDFLFDPRYRIPIISSLFFPIAQQLSGINAVFYYSNMFFDGIIDNPLIGTVAAFAVNVVATLLALPLVDRFGRKTLLSWSAGGMFICCILLTLALLKILPNSMAVVAVLIYITFFELGLGSIPFFLISELIEPGYFGRMQSLAMMSNWLCNFLVGMSFPFMVEHLGSFSFVPFAAALFVTFIYAIVWLPETRGQTLDEVMAGIERRQVGGGQSFALAAANEGATFV